MEHQPASGRLADRRIVITGAASGIGRATAELFRKEGATLFLIDKDAQGVGTIAELLGAFALPLDLSETAALAPAIDQAAAAMGSLDGIVNAAGLGSGKPIEDVDPAFLGLMVAVNFTAPFLLCAAAIPHMLRAGRGTVVNVASGQALLPNAPNATAYAGTKGGLVAFTKSLAAEKAPLIRANALCPGLTNTPMVAAAFAGWAGDPAKHTALANYALRRMAEPIEIAQAALFLTSDASSYITGVALAVDGGRCFH
jgi:NAD(P)-dependent dehydrogenase (short-subunit alcohol dehydrogenase family)